MIFIRMNVRYNGKTLELDAAWTKAIGQANGNVAFDRNGLVYFRTGEFSSNEFIYRMDRSGNLVDFANGVVVESLIPEYGFDFLRGKNYKGIRTNEQADGTEGAWKKGMDVAANGDIYIFTGYGGELEARYLKVFDSLGNLKSEDAAVRMIDKNNRRMINTLKIGRNGVLYMGAHFTIPADAVRPFGLAEGGTGNEGIGCTHQSG